MLRVGKMKENAAGNMEVRASNELERMDDGRPIG